MEQGHESPDPRRGARAAAGLIHGGGEMGERIRSFDWAQTPLGPIEGWPQSLATAVRILLSSRFPMFIWWGRALTNLYNDAYIPVLGSRHPRALGQPAQQIWGDIWPVVGPQAAEVFDHGRASWNDSLLLVMERHGYAEETYFTFSYSPAPDDLGGIGGVFCACSEETERVLGERRLRTLRDLGAHSLVAARTAEEACHVAAATLAANAHDIPFALVYLLDDDGRTARLCEAVGLAAAERASPLAIALDGDDPWSLRQVYDSGVGLVADRLDERFGGLPAGPWAGDVTRRALVLPLASAGAQERPAGFLIAGLSPRLPLTGDYRSFLDLAAGHLATAVANARAYEAERRRAEALAELDRAKTSFFANVSHEFRTPLTLLLGPLEDVLREAGGALPPGSREQIEVARRNALRMLKLVNSLLEFTRIEAGRVEASYEPTDLAAATADLASIFRSTVERAGLRFHVSCEPLPEPVFVDRDMWEKVVLNLISNAFKFTFDGQIDVALRAANGAAELVVRDSGIGIAPEDLPRLFERFRRVDGARGRSFEGSGIGLALVQELVRLHGGSVRAESAIDRGSTFTVRIPFGSAHLPAGRIRAPHTLASTAVGGAYVEEALRWLPSEAAGAQPAADPQPARADSRARILLADDNADMRGYIQRLLGEAHDVVAVGDGAAALEALTGGRFDLALLDVMMPRLDGIALLRALRADERTRQLPVMLLSARAGEDARIEGVEAGADDYLTKPFGARELLARVRAQLALTRLRRDALRREQELREAEELVRARLERILEGIRDDFVMYDDDWRYVYVNDQAARSLGLPKEQLIGRRIWDMFPGAVGNLFHREMLAAKAEGRERVFEHYYAPWGKWIENRAYPLPDGMLLFSADITARKLAEEALRLSDERARLAIEAAQLGTWHYDPETGAVVLDDRMRAMCGAPLSAESLALEGALALIHPEDREDVARRLSAALEPEASGMYASECRIVWPNGTVVWLAANGQAQFTDAGGERRVTRLIGTALDVTERKRAEAERERRLAEEQRLRAQAEEASRLKDEFLATVSHELRTPLTAFLGYAQLLQRRHSDPEYVARTVEKLVRSATDQAQLIEDLLDVSRIVSGKLRLDMQRIDFRAVVGAALDTVRPTIEAKGLALQLDLGPGRRMVMGDGSRLQQVVWNLLSNATKFTPPGGRIAVRLAEHDGSAELLVSDTGSGISAAFLPYVFDRFRQADATSSRSHTGLGLGLSIVRHLVDLHGGAVEAASDGAGRGATFIVRLPLASSEARAPRTRAAEVEPPLAERCPPELEGLRIVLVDDQPQLLELVQEILLSCGAIVRACGTAREALEAVRSWRPDVLVSDIAMPGEDGYWLIGEVRALPPSDGGSVPAAALTAYVQSQERVRVLRAGFQHFVSKPVDTSELLDVVARLAQLRAGE